MKKYLAFEVYLLHLSCMRDPGCDVETINATKAAAYAVKRARQQLRVVEGRRSGLRESVNDCLEGCMADLAKAQSLMLSHQTLRENEREQNLLEIQETERLILFLEGRKMELESRLGLARRRREWDLWCAERFGR